jgi:hypothetical protein
MQMSFTSCDYITANNLYTQRGDSRQFCQQKNQKADTVYRQHTDIASVEEIHEEGRLRHVAAQP